MNNPVTLYHVVCEYDIGLNIDGISGCYSSKDRMMADVERGAEDCGLSFDELDNDGLIWFDTLKG